MTSDKSNPNTANSTGEAEKPTPKAGAPLAPHVEKAAQEVTAQNIADATEGGDHNGNKSAEIASSETLSLEHRIAMLEQDMAIALAGLDRLDEFWAMLGDKAPAKRD